MGGMGGIESNLVFLQKYFKIQPHNLPLRKPCQHTMQVDCFLTLLKKTTAADKFRALQQLRIASSIGDEFDFNIRFFESWIRFIYWIATSYWALLSLCPIRRPYNYGCSFLPKMAYDGMEKKKTHQIPIGIQPKGLYLKVIRLVKIYSDRVAVRRKQGYQFPICK